MQKNVLIVLSAGILVLCLSGCGGAPEGPLMVKVTGPVLIDGQPVPEGDIIFRRPEDQKGFGGRIKDGAYEIKVEPGKMAVEITASRVVPGKFDRSNPEPEPLREMYIPKQYNAKTTLVADVQPSDNPTFAFELKSK
ncbi:hypothetical protein [Planctomicrobium piriforme]|uniref:Carboxypeptidase regulatory-like domain-containing protein n=1 Tax=Planctomicrobium piriforme TaxID=1576369 RepID=A0A1I3RLE8_9PLAN|nr:hypothetical protein [Planctomicrobium piriforme]SFJ46850.1 hypothetical protein SAMN05421753_12136 [Planctomicrobium piriforme]